MFKTALVYRYISGTILETLTEIIKGKTVNFAFVIDGLGMTITENDIRAACKTLRVLTFDNGVFYLALISLLRQKLIRYLKSKMNKTFRLLSF